MIDYGKTVSEYDKHYTSELCKGENYDIKRWLYTLDLQNKGNILDVGCGTGFTLDLVPLITPKRYCGVDASAKMLEIARKKHPRHKFIHAKAKEMNFEGEAFDAALCLFSIPYIGEDAVGRIYDALKPGGLVLCVCYNKPYLNPSSVYGGHKWKYLFTVAPKVKKVLEEFEHYFSRKAECDLAEGKAYKIIIFQKE